MDMSKSDTFPEAVTKAVNLFGRIDILINNAGTVYMYSTNNLHIAL